LITSLGSFNSFPPRISIWRTEGGPVLIATFLEFPEAFGKEIQSLRVYRDRTAGREVHIAFSDGTAIAIEIVVECATTGKHYRSNQGDLEVLHEYSEAPARKI
jgi:hypothetical protein